MYLLNVELMHSSILSHHFYYFVMPILSYCISYFTHNYILQLIDISIGQYANKLKYSIQDQDQDQGQGQGASMGVKGWRSWSSSTSTAFIG